MAGWLEPCDGRSFEVIWLFPGQRWPSLLGCENPEVQKRKWTESGLWAEIELKALCQIYIGLFSGLPPSIVHLSSIQIVFNTGWQLRTGFQNEIIQI